MTNEEFQDEENRILSKLPMEFRAAAAYRAYEVGHAYGYHDILVELDSIVDMLIEPIKNYTVRLSPNWCWRCKESPCRCKEIEECYDRAYGYGLY